MAPATNDRRVRTLVAVVAGLGATTLTLTVLPSWGRGFGELRLLGLTLLCLAAVNAHRVTFPWKGQSEQISADEIFFIAIVVMSPPPGVAAAVLFASVFGSLRFRLPRIKELFNLGCYAVSLSLALAVTSLVAGGVPTGTSPSGLAGAAAGALAMHVSQTLMVRLVVSVADRLPYRTLFARTSLLEVMFLTCAVAFGLLAGLAVATSSWLLLLMLPPLAILVFVLEQHASALRDRSQLDELLATAVTANRAVGVPEVCDVLTKAAERLLHTSDARVQLEPPAPDEIGSALHADGTTMRLVVKPRPGRPGRGARELLDGVAAIGTGAVGSAELLAKLRHQAFHDGLTGLPNRIVFDDRLQQALRREGVGVLYIDLDRFKRVNDSLGHRVGDLLLQRVGERLLGCLRSCDSAARIGGDEFAVLLGGPVTERDAGEVAARLRAAIARPYQVEGRDVILTASVGVALAPIDGTDGEELLRAAGLAMHDAKEQGRDGVRRASPRAPAYGGLALETDLRQALTRGELWVAYQPQFHLRSMTVVGTEALVRWTHPERGLLRPDEFLPLAEEAGLLGAIDEWVLREACRQTAHWRATATPDLRVSVNISDAPLRSGRVHELVVEVLAEHGLAPESLELEVTERVVAMEDDTSLETLHRLRALGVRVAIDDFGTGYSSLSRLRTLPADVVKIDQSFVREIADAHALVPLVTSTLGMAHGLGLEVVAEGVETPEQLRFLTEKGCEMAQGYLLGRPMAADKLEALLLRAPVVREPELAPRT